MKKILLLLTLCFTLTSCSSAGTKSETDVSSVSESSVPESVSNENKDSEQLKSELLQMTNCYKQTDFTLPDNMYDISMIFNFSDGRVAVAGSDTDFRQRLIYVTDKDFSQFTPFYYTLPEETQNYDVCYDTIYFNADGSFNVTIAMEDHGGIKVPDEYDENFDYQSYYENFTTTNMICTYDSNANLLTKVEIEYPEELNDDYGSIVAGATIAEGDSILQPFGDGSIRRISADGTFTTVYSPENSGDNFHDSPHLFRDRDGKIIVMMTEATEVHDSNGNTGIETNINFREFDGEKMSDILYSCKDYELSSSVIAGRGDYRFFVSTDKGLIGIKDNGSSDTVIDWLASSMDAMTAYPCGETDFIGMNWNSDEKTVKLIPRDMSELANVEIITVSNCDTKLVNKFNNANDKYRVQVIDYPYDDDNQTLNMDIISGNAPDVICGLDYSTYLNYRSKGLFADLYELMDDELDKEMIMPNVITALESQGKLYSLCTSFDINTLVTKTRVCDKENWTFDDMLSLYDNAPESFEHIYDGETKLDMFRRMFYTMNDLIDYENVACNFDSPEFIKLLEFCNRFVDTVDKPEKWDDYEAFSQYMTDKYHWLGNDKVLA